MQTGIPGLTTDSATQTSKDGHKTNLPIWLLSKGIGIIKLPRLGINIGGMQQFGTNCQVTHIPILPEWMHRYTVYSFQVPFLS
jgi:hypothetical protein